MKKLLSLVIASLMLASPALAETTAGRTDHSGILVWAFLGFCALIVVAQLLPALLVILGVVKSTEPAKKAAAQKH
ncbi:MAG: hypothetical protein JXR59_07380 [Desulfuromonadaceae bacterium]|nr:hypothetical protein [Desulfuromonadaceae bacterium]